jgi:hypothetical protein
VVYPVPKPARKKKVRNMLKHQRIINRRAIEEARKEYSELSGLPTFGAPPHHVIAVGAGGPDHAYNLIQLTGPEHIRAHAGKPPKDVLFGIIATREGITVEELKSELNKMRGRE